MTPSLRRRLSALVLLTSGCLASAAFLVPTTSAVAAPTGPSSSVASAATNPVRTFDATSATVGAIPDGPDTGGTCSTTTPAVREVQIPVSGMAAGPIDAVQLKISIAHPKLGDVGLALQAPDGTLTGIIDRVGAATVGCGDETGVNGTISFADPSTNNLVAYAGSLSPDNSVTAGSFYPETAGGVRVPLTAPFAGVTNPNGTWKLRVLDYEAGNVGRVYAATLLLRSADKRQSAACLAATAAIRPARQARNAAQSKLGTAKNKLAKARAHGSRAAVVKAAKKVARKKAALARANKVVNATFDVKNQQCN